MGIASTGSGILWVPCSSISSSADPELGGISVSLSMTATRTTPVLHGIRVAPSNSCYASGWPNRKATGLTCMHTSAQLPSASLALQPEIYFGCSVSRPRQQRMLAHPQGLCGMIWQAYSVSTFAKNMDHDRVSPRAAATVFRFVLLSESISRPPFQRLLRGRPQPTP